LFAKFTDSALLEDQLGPSHKAITSTTNILHSFTQASHFLRRTLRGQARERMKAYLGQQERLAQILRTTISQCCPFN
jgi:hypothetical protein